MNAWKQNLPLRVATITAGWLTLVLLVTGAAFYVVTALQVRRGVDNGLLAAAPITAGSVREIIEHARDLAGDRFEQRRLQVLDPDGGIRSGTAILPVDRRAVAVALRSGAAFVSLVGSNGTYSPRTGPEWWQALTPRQSEVRVMYAVGGPRFDPVILQLAAPVGSISESLPVLFGRILLLAALAALVCGLIVWRMAREFYRPLHSIVATADAITPSTLSRRIPDAWGDRTMRHLTDVLNAMIARLQGSFEAQARFVAAAAHELRSPLGAMRAELEVALRRQRTPAEYRTALQGAVEETGRLAALADSLLLLARYERGAAPNVEHGLAVTALLTAAEADVRRTHPGQVEIDAPDDLRVDGDPVALERALANLMRNGLQAGSPAVQVTAQAEGEGVAIAVRDEGRGIVPEALPHLFEPFYRGDLARRRDGGTGLGLAIVKSVVDGHGGRIAVDSAPGSGTVVRLWLPARQP